MLKSLSLHKLHPFFIRRSNFGAEAESSFLFFCDLSLQTFLQRNLDFTSVWQGDSRMLIVKSGISLDRRS